MEIKVTIPKYMNTQMKKVSVDEVEFNKDLIEFIENLENKSFLDEKLQQKLLNYGINEQEFNKMIEELYKFSEYDDDKEHIGFPYESWVDRLLQVYSNSNIDKI